MITIMVSHWRQRFATLLVLCGVTLAMSAASADAQARQNRPRAMAPPAAGEGVSPGEIQRLFDAYVVMQAQEELKLTDEQYPRFLTRVRALQDVRRRHQNERGRLLQELRRITQNNADETLIRPRLTALADLDERSVNEAREAMKAVDEVLDLRQQAQFRVFEEQMERRKVELVLRAQQGNRRNQQRP
jgi:hypothetical protein